MLVNISKKGLERAIIQLNVLSFEGGRHQVDVYESIDLWSPGKWWPSVTYLHEHRNCHILNLEGKYLRKSQKSLCPQCLKGEHHTLTEIMKIQWTVNSFIVVVRQYYGRKHRTFC